MPDSEHYVHGIDIFRDTTRLTSHHRYNKNQPQSVIIRSEYENLEHIIRERWVTEIVNLFLEI
jgi:hypothetical protein